MADNEDIRPWVHVAEVLPKVSDKVSELGCVLKCPECGYDGHPLCEGYCHENGGWVCFNEEKLRIAMKALDTIVKRNYTVAEYVAREALKRIAEIGPNNSKS